MNHLGGHMNKTHIDYGVFDYLNKKFNLKSYVDVGCGPADMVKYAREQNLIAYGIDGDTTLLKINDSYSPQLIIENDFTKSEFLLEKLPEHFDNFDLGWSVEFLEHVEEKYLVNVLPLFAKCKYVIITHALPGDNGGHHHVNLQYEEYWIELFKSINLIYDEIETKIIKEKSTMHKKFMQKTGKFFINERYN